MKQMVRLTRRQKEEISKAGEDPKRWSVIEVTKDGTIYGSNEKADACMLMFIVGGRAKKIRIQKKDRNKNGIKKMLRSAGEGLLGIAVSAVFIYMLFFADPGETYTPPQQYRQAINSDYMIPVEQYDQYLAERQAYLDAEMED